MERKDEKRGEPAKNQSIPRTMTISEMYEKTEMFLLS